METRTSSLYPLATFPNRLLRQTILTVVASISSLFLQKIILQKKNNKKAQKNKKTKQKRKKQHQERLNQIFQLADMECLFRDTFENRVFYLPFPQTDCF